MAAIAPWFRLRLPSCGPWFESQAQKEAGIGPFFKIILLFLKGAANCCSVSWSNWTRAFLKNGPIPASFLVYFRSFSNKQYNFYNQCENMSKCPSSIWHRDSNPRPYELESSPITTRPGLPKRAFLQHTFIRSLTPSSEHQLRDLQTGFH